MCGYRPGDDTAGTTPEPMSGATSVARSEPVGSPLPPAAPSPGRPPGTMSRANVALAVAIALVVLSLLASGYLIVTVTGLRSRLDDEKAARTSAQDRITILEGTMDAVQSDDSAIHSALDAQAAADPAAIAARVQPSVYTVETSVELGSAWVVDTDHITSRFVTNYHVIASAWEDGSKHVQVYQQQGAPLDGVIEQALPDIDLAVVDVKADIPPLKASNETPRAGEAVLVIGSPLGLGGSVTTGAVSALREDSGMNFIQFSAPISPGNSGGPLVNASGEVIGITEAKSVAFGAEGIAIAIPVNQVCTRLHIC